MVVGHRGEVGEAGRGRGAAVDAAVEGALLVVEVVDPQLAAPRTAARVSGAATGTVGSVRWTRLSAGPLTMTAALLLTPVHLPLTVSRKVELPVAEEELRPTIIILTVS